MNDFFFFRSDMHPFPGGPGVELVSIWVWRSLLWIVGGLAACAAVDAASERVRQAGGKWIRRIAPALVCGLAIPGLALTAWLLYLRAPKCEFIVQWNRMLSVPEIGFVVLAVLAGAAAIVNRLRKIGAPCWAPTLVRLLTLALVATAVSTLGWKVIVYRGVWLLLGELLASLALFSILLARLRRAGWRRRGWKSAFPMAAWSLALVVVILGWFAWLGLVEMAVNACA